MACSLRPQTSHQIESRLRTRVRRPKAPSPEPDMRYLHLDVFTDTPFEGNQLAVCPAPAPDLSARQMQRIANEMAFSETTFVLPKENAGDVKMRIFTPQSEL